MIRKLTAIALSAIMALSSMPVVYASQPQAETAIANPYVTGGRIRNTETVPLNWDLEEPTFSIPAQTFDTTLVANTPVVNFSGIPLGVLDCITDLDLSVTIPWAEPYISQFEEATGLDCTDPGGDEAWEDWATSQAITQLLAMLAEIDDCEPPPPPPPDDCTPSERDLCGDFDCFEFDRDDNTDEQDEGSTGLQDEEEFDLRWNNIAFAFAETHMATSGFNNAGPSSPASSINLTRTSEVFQAMARLRMPLPSGDWGAVPR